MDQYDVSPEMKRLYEKKSKQRAAAKAYYQNLVYNPYRPVNDGAIFDPAIFRFGAMSAYHVNFFKPTAKHYFGYLVVLSPIFLIYLHVNKLRREKENLLRSGTVKYEDRPFKLYY